MRVIHVVLLVLASCSTIATVEGTGEIKSLTTSTHSTNGDRRFLKGSKGATESFRTDEERAFTPSKIGQHSKRTKFSDLPGIKQLSKVGNYLREKGRKFEKFILSQHHQGNSASHPTSWANMFS
ncbi:hypothetical protein F441_05194 [Phytophthora nicotianae CJ01A1]|uniref:RxLR effector protein n=4 Tax=Phytophthora nicotianae TaxID=4792 RepID=V9FK36_PHYNI|nr:hypothetical protein F443_05190 [Phytophthora nicotianae P1569]ETK91325.1 hypothetical protein L915_05056 [Phytophthora nicotianae]ETO80202.1 hypothetical protein F444_05222 [Phytophthora nicotianae P1976]ETP21215.1 hypothetical protein F441_05194 [Phytophthora nicotianae CJ01A1]KUF76620.1 hypothetical protein AM587_10001498 [Phytophthora nicotianae]